MQLLSDGTPATGSLTTSDNVVSVQDLHVRFRRCAPLQGVNLTIKPGTVFALLGENGVGKTTFIRCLTGYQRPSQGTVEVLGFQPQADPLEVRKRVGYVSDSPALYGWMRIDRMGAFAASLYGGDFFERFQWWAGRFELPPDRKIKHLSRGQLAKVALSLSLAADPQLLIMDEPTAGLDPKVRREFLESMIDRAADGRTIFLSSHQIHEVERVADEVAILHNGKIQLCGSINEIKSSMELIEADFEDPLVTVASESLGEVVVTKQNGRSKQWFVKNPVSELEAPFANVPGVMNVRRRRLSLEEIFIAITNTSGDDQPSLERIGMNASGSRDSSNETIERGTHQ